MSTLPMEPTTSSPAPVLVFGIAHPLYAFLSYACFSSSHISYLNALTTCINHTYYSEAIRHFHWHEAMSFELRALEDNLTWTLKPLPLGKKPIGSK